MTDDTFLRQRLEERRRQGALRRLPNTAAAGLIDFCSNDYLGLVNSGLLWGTIARQLAEGDGTCCGSTGSRLISGNSNLVESTEARIASFQRAERALIFNSGYDANLGLLSSIPEENDIVLYDERVHASIRDGLRLSRAKSYPVRHNDLEHLEHRLGESNCRRIFVAIESIYSMDGDEAPLAEIATACERHGARLLVDEAHATGVYGPGGRGLVAAAGLEDQVFARVHTFGKALGCHGGAVVGTHALIDVLINYARSFIYTTALPPASLIAIDTAYALLADLEPQRQQLRQRIDEFRLLREGCAEKDRFLDARGPIQGWLVPGNDEVVALAGELCQLGFDVRAIRSPTVRRGRERLRISLHAHNTRSEIEALVARLTG